MGPSLSGLEGLLRLPTGCGEQNMVKFAPNIFVMQYLNSTKQLTDEVHNKAVGFLRTGNGNTFLSCFGVLEQHLQENVNSNSKVYLIHIEVWNSDLQICSIY